MPHETTTVRNSYASWEKVVMLPRRESQMVSSSPSYGSWVAWVRHNEGRDLCPTPQRRTVSQFQRGAKSKRRRMILTCVSRKGTDRWTIDVKYTTHPDLCSPV
jgi:hypothetical protein